MKKSSKITVVPVLLFALFSLVFPSAGQQESDTQKVKIAFSMDSIKERWGRDREAFIKRAEEMGAEVMVQSAGGNDSIQAAQARMMMKNGADILVIIPHNLKLAGGIVNVAHKEFDIKVIAYDRLVRDCDLDLYISFDAEKVGELQAEALVSRVPKGNYVIIGGSNTDNNALQFHKGQMNVLKPYIDRGDVNIIADQWATDWLAPVAAKIMEAALDKAGNDVQAVVASNDVLAGGALEVLEARGLAGKVTISGQDADLEACQRIAAGRQTMTVYKSIDELARTAAEVAVKMVRAEKINHLINNTVNNGYMDVPAILLEPVAVDAGNMDQVIMEGGFHSREDVYKGIPPK